MRIDQIELRHIKMKLIQPFETSMGVENFEEHIIVRVEAGGVTGWGECVVEPLPWYSPETVTTAWHILRDGLIPAVLGQESDTVGGFIHRWQWVRGHRMAKAGLESALWDAWAKQQDIPLSRALGGNRDKVEVGVSIGIQSAPQVLVDETRGFLDQGYKRIKIKIAPGRDLSYIEAIRRVYPDILFQVDANSAYRIEDADTFRAMEPYNLLLIEQPLGFEDIFDHARLQKMIQTPLCLDESIHSLGDARAALGLESCRIINIKPGRVGGFSESIKIHDYCREKNIPLWHGGMLESGIGRAGNLALASLPGFTLPGDISASKRYFEEDIVEPEFCVQPDGMMQVPQNAGIGVEVIAARLDKITVTRQTFR